METFGTQGKVDRSGAAALPKNPHVESFRTRMYNELGESVMGWLSGMTERKEHGAAELSQETMDQLGVPQEGMNDVHEDHAAVRRVFDATSHDENSVGRAAPRTEAALKTSWDRLTSTTCTGTVYLWYKQLQEKVVTFGIPLMPFRGISLQRGEHGLCLPGLGLGTYETCGKTLCGVLRLCMPDDESEDADSIRETMACHANGFALLWHVLRVIVKMMDTHVVPKLPTYTWSLAKHAGC